MQLLILFVFCLLFPILSMAADTPPPEDFEDPYEIEVLIFERFGQGRDENWPEEPGEPDASLAMGSLTSPGLQGDDVVLLPTSAEELGPSAYTLKKKGAIVHLHKAWQQDVKSRSTPAWLSVNKTRLQGLLRVSKGRFLHLETDLMLKDSGADSQSYPIALHRRMRSDELHYVDHPKVGILVRAERLAVNRKPEVSAPVVTDPVPVTPVDEPGEEQSPRPGSLPRALPDPT